MISWTLTLLIFLHAGVHTPQSFCLKRLVNPKALLFFLDVVRRTDSDVLNIKYSPPEEKKKSPFLRRCT